MTKNEFVEAIALAVKKIAPEFGILVYSPVIAQAILESGWGTSNKAKYHNYFGLKYRDGRVDCHIGTFIDESKEQNTDGSYVPITDQWYSFNTLEDARYQNLKGITDWEKYIELIREDGYATSLNYIENIKKVVTTNNLTKYDKKENDNMNIIKSIMTRNPCYKANKTIAVKGLMLHSVGCPQPSAMVFINNWNKESYDRACVHAFIDANNGNVYQCLPWNHRGWHGGGSSNNTHIGVEMCEPSCIKYTGGSTFTCSDITKAREAVTKTYNSAVELFAYLCEQYNLNPLTDICSHSEGYKKGIASNHGDPEHLWKQLSTGYTMDGFRKDVQKKMGIESNVEIPKNETSTTKKFPQCPFVVKVIIPDLNYRTKPSMSGVIKGQTGKESFTIVEVNNGWGKLKSGAGWIYLENEHYCTINKTTKSTTSKTQTTKKKTNEQIAKEVLQGKWGNGSERKKKLEAAGYNYSAVQSIVNKLCK